jgi:hypothetical protein
MHLQQGCIYDARKVMNDAIEFIGLSYTKKSNKQNRVILQN